MTYFVGIDVGGRSKGFHASVLEKNSRSFSNLFQSSTPSEIVNFVMKYDESEECSRIAIDSPPQAFVESNKTRLAERQLHSDGYHILWTPRRNTGNSSSEWLRNGQKIWDEFEDRIGSERIIETFPTASVDGLGTVDECMSLSLLNDQADGFKHREDYLDASICALVAKQHYINEDELRVYGVSNSSSDGEKLESDQLGPIYVL